MNPIQRWLWRHKWCIHNTRTFLWNRRFPSAESRGICKTKPVLLSQRPAPVLAPSYVTASRCVSGFTWIVDVRPSLCFQLVSSSAISALFPLSLFNLTQRYIGCTESKSGSSSEQRIKALNILWSCWKTTKPKRRRFKQKLIYFSTQKPCLDSLPGSGVTGTFSVPCALRNPKWHIREKFKIKCVQAPENMKSETSRFPRALSSYRFPSLLAGTAMFFPSRGNPLLWLLASFDWGGGSALLLHTQGGCWLCSAPPALPRLGSDGKQTCRAVRNGSILKGKMAGEKISICTVMFLLFINKQAAFVPPGAGEASSIPYFSCI